MKIWIAVLSCVGLLRGSKDLCGATEVPLTAAAAAAAAGKTLEVLEFAICSFCLIRMTRQVNIYIYIYLNKHIYIYVLNL